MFLDFLFEAKKGFWTVCKFHLQSKRLKIFQLDLQGQNCRQNSLWTLALMNRCKDLQIEFSFICSLMSECFMGSFKFSTKLTSWKSWVKWKFLGIKNYLSFRIFSLKLSLIIEALLDFLFENLTVLSHLFFTLKFMKNCF